MDDNATKETITAADVGSLPAGKPADNGDKQTAAMVSVAMQMETTIEGGLLARWLPEAKKAITNLAPEGEQEKSHLTRAMTKADKEPLVHLETPFLAKWYVMHEAQTVDPQTGEVKDLVRLVLIAPDGQTLSTCSKPALDGFRAILAAYGGGPWDPPIRAKFRKWPSKSHPAGHYFSLHAEPRELPASKKK